MKNKLPEIKEPDRYDPRMNYMQREFNQLIDYLAELTEVVEGKQEPRRHYDGGECTCEKKNYIEPSKGEWVSLKETLLEEIGELKQYQHLDFPDRLIRSLDVEAIINRLMP